MMLACPAVAPAAPDGTVSYAIYDEGAGVWDPMDSAIDPGRSVSVGDVNRRVVFTRFVAAAAAAQHDNWDALGSARVQPGSFIYARRFLNALSSSIPMPSVAVETDGEICFDWHLGPRRTVAVSVGRDGTLGFASLIGDESLHGISQYRDGVPTAIAALLERLDA